VKAVDEVRNFLIVVNVKPGGFPVYIRYNGGPLLETVLGCPKCYNMSLADSTNRTTNRNFNRKLVNKWSIGKVIRVVS